MFVPGQISDYYAHRSGLKGHAADTSWHPDDIDSTIFDFPAWQREQEDDMPNYREWPQSDRDALSADVVKALLAAPIDLGDDKRRSLAQVVKELWNTQKRRSGK